MSERAHVPFCSRVNEKIAPCTHLSSVLQFYGRGTRYQGVEKRTLINIETRKHSRDLIILKSGDHGKKGVVINFCPFCRAELRKGAERSRRATLSKARGTAKPGAEE